jgi:hypothetical protein
VDQYQRRIQPDSRWRMAGQGRRRSCTSDWAPGGVAATLLPTRRSRAAGTAGPGAADGILANPAGRPEGPGGHSPAAAAMRSRRLRSSRSDEPAAVHSVQKCRPLIPPARGASGNEAIPLRDIRSENDGSGPRSIHMRNCGVRDESGVSVTGVGVIQHCRRHRSDADENDGRNKNCAHHPDARPAGGVLARGQPNGPANLRESVR